MTLRDSPIRLLYKSYAGGVLNRKQYLDIRKELLRKLDSKGHVNHADLENFLKLHRNKDDAESVRRYNVSDWIIIILGLTAALALGIMLYS